MKRVISATLDDFNTDTKMKFLRLLTIAEESDCHDVVVLENFNEETTFDDLLALVKSCRPFDDINIHLVLDKYFSDSLSYDDRNDLMAISENVNIYSNSVALNGGKVVFSLGSKISEDEIALRQSYIDEPDEYAIYFDSEGESTIAGMKSDKVRFEKTETPLVKAKSFVSSIHEFDFGGTVTRVIIEDSTIPSIEIKEVPLFASLNKSAGYTTIKVNYDNMTDSINSGLMGTLSKKLNPKKA